MHTDWKLSLSATILLKNNIRKNGGNRRKFGRSSFVFDGKFGEEEGPLATQHTWPRKFFHSICITFSPHQSILFSWNGVMVNCSSSQVDKGNFPNFHRKTQTYNWKRSRELIPVGSKYVTLYIRLCSGL